MLALSDTTTVHLSRRPPYTTYGTARLARTADAMRASGASVAGALPPPQADSRTAVNASDMVESSGLVIIRGIT